MYNDEQNLYHYTYRKDGTEPGQRYDAKQPTVDEQLGSYRQQQEQQTQNSQPVYQSQPQGGQTPHKNGKNRLGLKIASLALVCALLGGLVGGGTAYLVSNSSSSNTTEVNVSNRKPTEIQLKTVDGKNPMTDAELYAANVNSVVSINSAVSTNIFGQKVESASSGSGFVITQDGYIVTNQHVVSGASSINVTLYNGDTYPATVVGGDSDYDVAVLKIEATGLQAVTLGKSADVNVGDTVMAIGNPLGELTFSMSQGIVSCCDRAINVDGTPFNMIQVDASINPGNSGGPLMNLYGEVVGIVSAKYSSYSNTTVEGIGFAIPISDVQTIITDIMENGQVTDKAYMAIKAGSMTEQMAAQYNIDVTQGVFVYAVEKGGAGEKAGLQLGDVITKLNDTEITSMSDLSMAKKGFKAGDTVTLTVWRGGQEITLSLTFDEQPQTTGTEDDSSNQNQGQQDSYGDLYDYFFGRGNSGRGNSGRGN